MKTYIHNCSWKVLQGYDNTQMSWFSIRCRWLSFTMESKYVWGGILINAPLMSVELHFRLSQQLCTVIHAKLIHASSDFSFLCTGFNLHSLEKSFVHFSVCNPYDHSTFLLWYYLLYASSLKSCDNHTAFSGIRKQ
jgi:hypothetical protein